MSRYLRNMGGVAASLNRSVVTIRITTTSSNKWEYPQQSELSGSPARPASQSRQGQGSRPQAQELQ